jgi:hypothetical protein
MRSLRRALAFALQVLLLQLLVLGSGAACVHAQHDAAGADTNAGAHAAAAVHHAAPHGPSAQTAQAAHAHAYPVADAVEPADAAPEPATPDHVRHCATAAGCVVFDLARAEPEPPLLQAATRRVPSGPVGVPGARRAPPEPPPPRV